MKSLLYFTLIGLFVSCAPKSTPPPPVVESEIDLTGYETNSMAGDAVRVTKSAEDVLQEEGFLLNGKKNGTWTIFYKDARVKSISNFINGFQTGPHFEFNAQGRLDLHANYNGGNLDGTYAKYEHGKPKIMTTYKNGQIDGTYEEYGKRGKLQKMVTFKNGIQHGKMEYYDEDGNVTVAYTYKDGEKVDGGIVNE